MKPDTDNEFTRRDFLKLTWGLGAGAVMPAFLAACSSSSTQEDTFDPPTLTSVNGILEVTFKLEYVDTILPVRNNDTGVFTDTKVHLRSFSSMIPGPTLRINAGDTLRINIINNLPPNPPSNDPEHLRYLNSTNLHVHGFHVNPGLIRPGVSRIRNGSTVPVPASKGQGTPGCRRRRTAGTLSNRPHPTTAAATRSHRARRTAYRTWPSTLP